MFARPMTVDELPTPVRMLIKQHLASMDHVEVLVRLYTSSPSTHTVSTLASDLALDRRLCHRILEDFVAGALAAVAGDGYRFEAAKPDREAVAQVLELYNARPLTLVRAIQSRPWPVKSFAEAFRIRKEREQ